MKILYIIPYPSFFTQHQRVGGHIAHCIGIINAFKKRGYDIRYFSEESDQLLKRSGVEIKTFPYRYKSFIGRQLWLFSFIKEMVNQIQEYKPDLIYMRYSTSVIFWYSFINRALKNIPLILEVNSLGSQRIKHLKYFDRKFLKTATSIIAISSLLQDYIYKSLNLRSNVVPNGLDKDRITETMVSLKKKNDVFTVVYAGLLKPDYGLEFAISVFDEIKNDIEPFEFILYGDGPFIPFIRCFAKTRPWLKIAGPVDFNEIPEKLTSANVLLYPTSKFNQFQSPTKLFEYMASGRPIIAAKTEQTSLLLKSGKFGFLYQLDCPSELKKAITDVLSNSTTAYQKAIEARKEVLAKHTWDSRVEMIMKTLTMDHIS